MTTIRIDHVLAHYPKVGACDPGMIDLFTYSVDGVVVAKSTRYAEGMECLAGLKAMYPEAKIVTTYQEEWN